MLTLMVFRGILRKGRCLLLYQNRRRRRAFIAEMGIFLSISSIPLLTNIIPPVFRGRVLSLVGKADLY